MLLPGRLCAPATRRSRGLSCLLVALALVPAAPAFGAVEIQTAAGTGVSGFSGDGGPATAAELALPIDVVAIPGGGYYIAEQANNRVRRVAADGTITTVAGSGPAGFSGDGGPATAATMDAPSGVAILPGGAVLVSDTNNNRVRRFTVGGNITTVAGTGAASLSGDGGAATAAAVRFPYGIAVRSDGSYVIADVDNHRIRNVTAGGLISTLAGTTAGFSGDGGPATSAKLDRPSGVSFAADGRLLIADTFNHRVRAVSTGGTISTLVGNGTASSTGDGGAASSATVNVPIRAVAVPGDASSYLIVDQAAHRVRKVSGAVIRTLAGTGTAGAGGDGGAPALAQLNRPYGASIDAAGRVLIADAFNQRIRLISTDTTPENTALPELSGTPAVGQALSCTQGTWTGSPTGISYATLWERAPRLVTAENDPAWSAIDGAVGSSYTVRDEDAGSRVRCRVTRTDAGGSTQAFSRSVRTDSGSPVNTSAPQLSGVPSAQLSPRTANPTGLTCSTGSWTNGPSFTYQWLRDGVPISGATEPTYVPRNTRRTLLFAENAEGDGGHQLSCLVTGTNDVGAGSARSESVLAVDGVPANTGAPSIVGPFSVVGGSPVRAETLCDEGTWRDGYGALGRADFPYRYRWLRDGTPIAGEVGRIYRIRVEDLGRQLSCEVTDANPVGASAPAASPSILVPLPDGDGQATVYRTGGVNDADPTNLMALSKPYLEAVESVVTDRLKAAVAQVTTACRGMTIPPGVPQDPRQMDNVTRCQILLHAPFRLSISSLGVRYLTGFCTLTGPFTPYDVKPQCLSLGIQLPAIDPKSPPAADAELLAKLAPLSAETILWDLDGDGRTDAACPGSAPVLRTILSSGEWHPRAVIVTGSSAQTQFFPSGTRLFNAPASAKTTSPGKLRDAQVKVCATAFDPPPDPEKTPCVTAGTIGRVQITGNLCPINTRTVPKDDYDVLDGSIKQVLQAQSEQLLKTQGAATRAAGASDRLDKVYVSLSPPEPGPARSPCRRAARPCPRPSPTRVPR